MLHQSGLSPRERAEVAACLGADPALGEEIEAIAEELSPVARERFLRAFAAECGGRRRPASAVLTALERAVLG